MRDDEYNPHSCGALLMSGVVGFFVGGGWLLVIILITKGCGS